MENINIQITEITNSLLTELREKGGCTFNFSTQDLLDPSIKGWIFPKYPDKTEIVEQNTLGEVLPNFIRKNLAYLIEGKTYLGLWLNPKGGKVYMDINTILPTKDEAIAYCRSSAEKGQRQVVAIHDLKTGENVEVSYE